MSRTYRNYPEHACCWGQHKSGKALKRQLHKAERRAAKGTVTNTLASLHGRIARKAH